MQHDEHTTQEAKGLRLVFRAMRHRNYRLFFFGQGISLTGTWMQSIAMAWLVYALTKSPSFLGLVGFLGQIPTFFLGVFIGVLVDRWSRHRILIATQSLAMVQAFILAALVLTHSIAPWHILLLALFMGFVNALDAPTRQAFVVDMVEDRTDLANAIALNSSMFNGARLIGPSIAGVLIPILGEGMCFLLNGISYIAVIVALAVMRVPRRQRERPLQEGQPSLPDAAGVSQPAPLPAAPSKPLTLLRELREGLAYAYRSGPIKYVLLLLGTLSLLAMPFTVLMPIFAKDILHGGPHTFGFLMASSGVGALVGALYLAARKGVLGLERWMALAPVLLGLALIAFSRSHIVWVSFALLLVAGFSTMVQIASCNTVLQTVVEDDKRGRVMSLYTVMFMGTAPFGSLFAGYLASKIGAADTLLINGGFALIGSLIFLTRLPAMTRSLRAHCARADAERRLVLPVDPTESRLAAGGE